MTRTSSCCRFCLLPIPEGAHVCSYCSRTQRAWAKHAIELSALISALTGIGLLLVGLAEFHNAGQERQKADQAISRAEQADRRSLFTAEQMRTLTVELAERNKKTDVAFAEMFDYVCTAEHGHFDFASRTCLFPDGRSLAYLPPSQ